MHRRTLLKAIGTLASLPLAPTWARASEPVDGSSFAFSTVQELAKKRAGQGYKSAHAAVPETLSKLDPEAYQSIEFDWDKGLWATDADSRIELAFYHVGMQFDLPIKMHVIDTDTGKVDAYPFRPELFDYHQSGVDQDKLEDKPLGFAGWRMVLKPRNEDVYEVASFLGASYFRAIDKHRQYGLSARALAIDTGLKGGEEFPDFVEFWFVKPAKDSTCLRVYALLDSPSLTGAFQFDIEAGDIDSQGIRMEVESHLYTRRDIERLGIAPMTSMYLKGTAQSRARDTIYPRMHDSDRLVMWRGNGEHLTRPLYNPPSIQFNSFVDENPQGFGLLQLPHDFASYRDPVTWYNRRPSLWVKPQGEWGKGAVMLMEMPTVGETVDNVVAFWQADKPTRANQHLHYAYTLYWQPEAPIKHELAVVDETRSGMGNVPEGWIPGDKSPQTYARRFAVDFVGGRLDALIGKGGKVDVKVSVTLGKISYKKVHALKSLHGYRAVFDWQPDDLKADIKQAVGMRAYLHDGEDALSETWLYQWLPPAPQDRHY